MPDDKGTLLGQENTDDPNAGKDTDDAANTDNASADKGADGADGGDSDGKDGSDKASSDDASSGDDKSGEDKEDGAPDKYEDFKLPENSPLDKAQVEEIAELAKKLNLSQEKAQELVDLNAKNADEFRKVLNSTLVTLREGWVAEIKGDAELGGSDYKEKVSTAVRAMNRFGSPGLRKLLDDSGFGDHPEMVRVFYKIGKAISEDTFVEGDRAGKDKPFYEKSNHNR